MIILDKKVLAQEVWFDSDNLWVFLRVSMEAIIIFIKMTLKRFLIFNRKNRKQRHTRLSRPGR
jgi:hypothetical protein